MSEDIYYQEVEVKPKRGWHWVNYVFLALAFVALGFYHLERRQLRHQAKLYQAKSYAADRYVAYAERFVALDAERDEYVHDFYQKCYRVLVKDYPEKTCNDLDYKIKRYNREIGKINDIYKDGGWVESKKYPPPSERVFDFLRHPDGSLEALPRKIY